MIFLLNKPLPPFTKQASASETPESPQLNRNQYSDTPGFQNVRVDKDRLDMILSSQQNMLNYESHLHSYERSLNKEISRNRIQLLKKFEQIQDDTKSRETLGLTIQSLTLFNGQIVKNLNSVKDLRT